VSASGCIPKDARPAALPVIQNTKFDLVISTGPKDLGISIPQALPRAEEVTE